MGIALELGKRAKEASVILARASASQKNGALENIAKHIENGKDKIIKANDTDIALAKENGIADNMIDRLKLTPERIDGMVEGVKQLISLPDPIGEVLCMEKLKNGLMVGKKRVPLGVIGIIYESRPSVTVDAAILCLKAGSAVILRGGKEAINSNIVLCRIMQEAIEEASLPKSCIQIVEDTDRRLVTEMMNLKGYIDVLIPRGGADLIKAVTEGSAVPVIETGTGNCHIYIDDSADINMGVEILFNAKTSRPSVCNAAESLLVNERIAEKFLPAAYLKLKERNVEIRGCNKTLKILPDVKRASEEDYYKEFLDYILSCKVVADIDEAILHINKYNSGHSEAIITENYSNAQRFLNEVDAAAVYVNASTRFTDGFEFGLGAEIGISTQKMHARGPMGLKEITSTKFIIYGDGQIR